MPAHHHSGLKTCDITRVSGTKAEAVSDVLAVEETLGNTGGLWACKRSTPPQHCRDDAHTRP
jgi:hypothetical protein